MSISSEFLSMSVHVGACEEFELTHERNFPGIFCRINGQYENIISSGMKMD